MHRFLKISAIYLIIASVVLLAGFAGGRWLRTHTKQNTTTNLHYGYFSTRDFFDRAFEGIQFPAAKKSPLIKGVVVNHHLLAADLIVKTLIAAASGSQPSTIVLISPNHRSLGKNFIITSRYNWKTPYGIITTDQKTVDALSVNGPASVEEKPFETEHGISGIVPFIKKIFPDARIVTIIVNDHLQPTDADAFSEKLAAVLPPDALIILSMDFSHYKPSWVSEAHDVESMRVLETLDLNGISKLDIDSKPGLRIFLNLMKRYNATKWDLVAHSNAAKILGHEIPEGTTSYVDGTFSVLQ